MTTPRSQRRFRSLPILILAGSVLLAAGAAMWFLQPLPKQTARTRLYVPVNPPNVLSPSEIRLSGDAFLRNQGYIIKDRFILNAALNQPEVAKLEVLKEQTDQLQWLENEIKVDFPSPEFIQISMSGDRPQELLVLVKAVRRAYLEKTGDKDLAERDALLANLKDILDTWEGRYKVNKRKLRELQERAGAANPENMALVQKIALEELAGAQKDLVRVRSEIRQLRVEIGLRPEWHEAEWPRFVLALNTIPASISPLHFAVVGLLRDELLQDEFLIARPHLRPLVSQAQLDNDPIAVELLKKIGKLKVDIITVKANSSSEAAFQKDSASLRLALDLAQTELEKRRQELRSQLEVDARARARNEERANETRSPRQRYAAALALEKILTEEVQRLDEMTANKNKAAVDLAEVQDEIDKAADIIRSASKKRDALEIEQKAPPRVREFGEGEIVKPGEGERKLWTIAPMSLAGLGVIVLAFAGMGFGASKSSSVPVEDTEPNDG
jgi:hypothetical protein